MVNVEEQNGGAGAVSRVHVGAVRDERLNGVRRGREEERGSKVAIAEIRIGATLKQEIQRGAAAGPATEQRATARGIPDVHVGAAVQEQSQDIEAVRGGGDVEERDIAIGGVRRIPRVDIGAFREPLLAGCRVPTPNGKRKLFISLAHIGGRPLLRESAQRRSPQQNDQACASSESLHNDTPTGFRTTTARHRFARRMPSKPKK